MSLTASVYCRAPHQIEWAKLVVAGLYSRGVQILGPSMPADIAIVWGTRQQVPLTKCRNVLVMERAYLGDRFQWLSLGWNGLNGLADFCHHDVPDDRWRKFWRSQVREQSPGHGALIIGQVQGDMAIRDVDIYTWAQEVSDGLTVAGVEHSYRAHPEALRRAQEQPLPGDRRPLELALSQCDSVITYNSNVGVLAAMAGKRVTCEDRGSMAFEIAGHGWMSDQDLGDRDEWGRKLAYCQWLPDEVERGDFWDTLGRMFDA